MIKITTTHSFDLMHNTHTRIHEREKNMNLIFDSKHGFKFGINQLKCVDVHFKKKEKKFEHKSIG